MPAARIKKGFVKNVPISDKSDEVLRRYIDNNNYHIESPDQMKAGDATWHAGWTLHSAPGNASASLKRSHDNNLFSDGAKVIEPQNKHQEDDRNRWLRGLIPGSLAASDFNPLI